jgi:hypothetical protein
VCLNCFCLCVVWNNQFDIDFMPTYHRMLKQYVLRVMRKVGDT